MDDAARHRFAKGRCVTCLSETVLFTFRCVLYAGGSKKARLTPFKALPKKGERRGLGRIPMDIHEYQAKELLSKFGVPIPRGGLAYSPEQATYRAAEIGGNKWVVKAQIHSGARSKAGGIKLCKNDMEIQHAAEGLLGKRLITHQTGPVGKLVSRLYIEEAADIAKEIYFALVMDRASERIMVVASAAGGM